MTTPAILDLNDTRLQLWHANAVHQSPGYALLEGNQYTFGEAARSTARLQPRNINTRYWWQLSTEKLQPALGLARHTADLVHAHLLDIHRRGGQPDELMLAVPGSMGRDQLALLLGIIGQCPFEAVGLVNRSVLLASGHLARHDHIGKLFHLEIQLHQAVISELACAAGQLELTRTIPLPGCGLLQLQERMVELVASAFIRQTRFDPRRKAESEQQLYDALPDVLQALTSTSEANVEVMGYRARVSALELRSAGELLFSSAPEAIGSQGTHEGILVDAVASLLPGLMNVFPQAEVIEANALPAAAELHRDILLANQREPEDDALPFIVALPCPVAAEAAADTPTAQPEPSSTAPGPPARPAGPAPTHLLVAAIATPLAAAGTPLQPGCELFYRDGAWLLRADGSARVNGTPWHSERPLYCGDRIEYNGHSALLIAVEQA